MEEKEWWYKNEFLLQDFDSHWEKKRKVELVFEGLDTFAVVYLNGERIGEADNMFIAHRFDVTDKMCKKNTLLVKFTPATSFLRKIQAKEGSLEAYGERARVYGRKAQYSFGWDWGPCLVGVGIWRKTYLYGYDEMHIDWVGMESRLSKGKATIKMEVEISSGIEEERTGEALLYLDGKWVKKESLKISPSLSKHSLSLEVKDPRLWYPRGYGDPNLYRLRLELFKEKKELIDVFEDRVGIREIKLVQEKDDEGKKLLTLLNIERESYS